MISEDIWYRREINSIFLLEICYYRNIFFIFYRIFFLNVLKIIVVVIGIYYIFNYM